MARKATEAEVLAALEGEFVEVTPEVMASVEETVRLAERHKALARPWEFDWRERGVGK